MKKVYGPWESGPMARILATLPGKLAGHWLAQGMTVMDPTEIRFKIGLDFVGASVAYPAMRRYVRSRLGALLTAAAVAHSLNFVLNGQILVVFKFHRSSGPPVHQLEAYAYRAGRRLAARSSVRSVVAYGSLARGELRRNSDLDIRVLRRPGLRSGIDACGAATVERMRSLISGIPLDISVWDSPRRAGTMRIDEHPVLLGGEAFS